MTENLLEWGLPTGFQHTATQGPLKIAEIIGETLLLFQPVVDHRELTVKFLLENGLSVCADARALRVLARNLLHNACKFSADRGCIRIMTQLDEQGAVLFRVFNDGVPLSGVMNDASAPILCPAEPHQHTGARLGLGISFNLAAQNGWKLRLGPTVDSDGTHGTEAILTIPGGFFGEKLESE
jgi:K+-sensing histidine kinase KdpD